MPRRAVGGCFCRKSKAKSKLLSCHSTVERRLGGSARESIYPRRERQCEKAALACFGHRNLPATGAIEAGSMAAGRCERRYDEGDEQRHRHWFDAAFAAAWIGALSVYWIHIKDECALSSYSWVGNRTNGVTPRFAKAAASSLVVSITCFTPSSAAEARRFYLPGKQKQGLTLLPENPRHPERYRYEGYREASELLLPAKSTTKAEGRGVRSRRALVDPQPAS
jgi:hypothetical protein